MSDEQPVIIKKVVKGGGHGHHGGAWKVAYADFVTAMMAFFLLMWLLNASSEDQKRGLSNYFGPAGDMLGAGGTGGVLGGRSIEVEGNFRETRASAPISTSNMSHNSDQFDPEGTVEENSLFSQKAGDGADAIADHTSEHDSDYQGIDELAGVDLMDEMTKPEITEDDMEEAIEAFEEEAFKEVEEKLRQAVQDIPDLKELVENLIIDMTPEGLRIQIVDQHKRSMFPSGSAIMHAESQKLLQLVAKIVQKLPNKISITGHTDSKPFANKRNYSNWELSTDRANASRRALLSDGLSKTRILYVTGKSDTEPLIPSDPENDKNRRISIILHRTSKA